MTIELNNPKIEKLFVDQFKSDVKKFSQFIVTLVEQNQELFLDKQEDIASLGGSLKQYANNSKRELEDQAWEMHIKDKYQTIDDTDYLNRSTTNRKYLEEAIAEVENTKLI